MLLANNFKLLVNPLSDPDCDESFKKKHFDFEGQELYDPISDGKCLIEYYPDETDVTIEFVNHVDQDPLLGRILASECSTENLCHPKATCKTDINNREVCYCNKGYDGNGIGENGCTELFECSTGFNDCKGNSKCIDIESGFDCECNYGYTSTDPHVYNCLDLDECEYNKPISSYFDTACPKDISDCINTVGSYRCECHQGKSSISAIPSCLQGLI